MILGNLKPISWSNKCAYHGVCLKKRSTKLQSTNRTKNIHTGIMVKFTVQSVLNNCFAMLKQKYCCKMPFLKEAAMIPFNQLSSANWAATYILFLIFAFIVNVRNDFKTFVSMTIYILTNYVYVNYLF